MDCTAGDKGCTKAYCIDPCENDDPMTCKGRLPLSVTTVVEIPDPLCPENEKLKPVCFGGKFKNAKGERFEGMNWYETAKKAVDAGEPGCPYPKGELDVPLDGVNMKIIGEYTLKYTCEKKIGGELYAALPKERVIKVIDTTKPVCATPTTKVTREASFPYSPDVPVCKDTYWGAQKRQPATVTTGTFNVEKTGTYILTYTATDHSGNVAPIVKQSIVVVDTLKPVIELSYGAKKFHRSDALDKGINYRGDAELGVPATPLAEDKRAGTSGVSQKVNPVHKPL